MERGIVRGRVASLLRSSEIKPYVLLICTFFCLAQKLSGSYKDDKGKASEDTWVSKSLELFQCAVFCPGPLDVVGKKCLLSLTSPDKL